MFKVWFNRKKQYFLVSLEEVSQTTFDRKGGGRWGYFIETWTSPYKGEFGRIHLVASKVRPDTIAHELLHLWIAWIKARDVAITSRNEERLVLQFDELTRHFWKEYGKHIARLEIS